MEAKVDFGEEVYVCGDAAGLGNFERDHAVQLFCTTKTYPIWESPVVTLPKGKMVQYKYAIFSGGTFNRWEVLDYNRFLDTADLELLAGAASSRDRANRDADAEAEAGPSAVTTSNDVIDITPPVSPPAPRESPRMPALSGGGVQITQSRFGDWTKEVGFRFNQIRKKLGPRLRFFVHLLISHALFSRFDLSLSLILPPLPLSLSDTNTSRARKTRLPPSEPRNSAEGLRQRHRRILLPARAREPGRKLQQRLAR